MMLYWKIYTSHWMDAWLNTNKVATIKIQNSESRWEIVKKKNYLPIVAPLLRIIHWMDDWLNTDKVLNYDSFYSLYIPHMSRIQLQREHLISLDSSVHRLPLLILYPFHLCCMKYLNHRQHRKMNQACASFQHIIYKYLKLYFMKDK
jgi:hypothetical protein